MGTPHFAVPSLQILLENGYDVVGVVTAPDKARGRGQQLAPSPVKTVALQNGLKVLQPEKLRAPDFLDSLYDLGANLQVVVAFRMLPELVWTMPEYGTFNLHASLLPDYRGAAPINWAIINGECKTGLTTFFIRQDIDTGHIIFQEEESISHTDTAGDLHDRLMMRGAGLVLKTVRAIEAGDPETTVQPMQGQFKSAPKIFREHCRIEWDRPAEEIRNLVRGLCPYPSAWTEIKGKVYKVHKVGISARDYRDNPGEVFTDGRSFICVATADVPVELLEIQAGGKRKMTVREFLTGNRL